MGFSGPPRALLLVPLLAVACGTNADVLQPRAATASASPQCAVPLVPAEAPPEKQPPHACPPRINVIPSDPPGQSTWTYDPDGLISKDMLRGYYPHRLWGGTAWQGTYGAHHITLAAGSVAPTEAQSTTPPYSYPEFGLVLLQKDPPPGAPDDAKPGMARQLDLPETPGPLEVTSADLPRVFLTGPTGEHFVVNLDTETVAKA